MGYIRGFVHGVVTGTIVGMCVAPQSGERTRAQLGAFGHAARESYDVASRTVRQIAPVVTGAASVARSQVARKRHQENSVAPQENGHR